ncbi:hypothetical protein [Bradyrhizobium sp. Ash2021]|uniref:hypothetical protein n=1 Tax=Bradyrhizobium sp. Ash2021 TaxID=2954771 RepID=UPI00281515FD|nr:hypothetical protein [Bradyrhizobium sp. Ash2021]WMT70931.1 hypothetical protein NL528_22690 [Bradyrhizobium sp. Ash2021]
MDIGDDDTADIVIADDVGAGDVERARKKDAAWDRPPGDYSNNTCGSDNSIGITRSASF